MTVNELLLTTLAEECVETAQRVSKALRFGLEEVQEGQPFNNAQRITYEFNDIVAMMQILQERGLLARVLDLPAIKLKKEKVAKYIQYSIECGTVQ
jgi:hypothetical protein